MEAKYKFGELVFVDETKSGSIVNFYGDGIYTVDFDGVWNFVKEDRISKRICKTKHFDRCYGLLCTCSEWIAEPKKEKL
jgi:hypothetical protein